jgi:hypothetical protein
VLLLPATTVDLQWFFDKASGRTHPGACHFPANIAPHNRFRRSLPTVNSSGVFYYSSVAILPCRRSTSRPMLFPA